MTGVWVLTPRDDIKSSSEERAASLSNKPGLSEYIFFFADLAPFDEGSGDDNGSVQDPSDSVSVGN